MRRLFIISFLCLLLIPSWSNAQVRVTGKSATTATRNYTNDTETISAYMRGGAFLIASNYDSLKDAFSAMAALDTVTLYIPGGTYVITDSIQLRFERGGAARWAIVGDAGHTKIIAKSTSFDSLKNMFNIITSGWTSSSDSVIAHLEISGIIFDFNNNGGTFRPWAAIGSDSAWHALRSYRDDNWDRFPPGGSSTVKANQWLWADSQGLILQTIGRILHLRITNCTFKNSFYGALRFRPYYKTNISTYGAAVEGGEITHCEFRDIRGGPAVANLWNGIKTVSNNYFRNVACGYYNHTGGSTFSHNRIEEYDSCGVYSNYGNWISISDNVISEGAGPALIFGGNCSGTVTGNSTLNVWADNAHLGVDRIGDSTLAIIKFESPYAAAGAYPRGLIIANNFHSTSDANYDGYTQYYIAAVDLIDDSTGGNIIVNNSVDYGLGKDAVLGLTNLSHVKNMIFPNMRATNTYAAFDSLWVDAVDTVKTGGGTIRWMKIKLSNGTWFWAPSDTATVK